MTGTFDAEALRIIEDPESASNQELRQVWASAFRAGNVAALERLVYIRRKGLEYERLAKVADLLAEKKRYDALFQLCYQYPHVLKEVSLSRTMPVLLRYCTGSAEANQPAAQRMDVLTQVVATASERALALSEIPRDTWTTCMTQAIDMEEPGVVRILRNAPVKRLHDPLFLAEMLLRAYHRTMRYKDTGNFVASEAPSARVTDEDMVRALLAPATPSVPSDSPATATDLDTSALDDQAHDKGFQERVLDALTCVLCPVPPLMLDWFVEIHHEHAADWLFTHYHFDIQSLPYTQFTLSTRVWLWNRAAAARSPVMFDGIIRACTHDEKQVRPEAANGLYALLLQLQHRADLHLVADLLANAGYVSSLLVLYETVQKMDPAIQRSMESQLANQTLFCLFESSWKTGASESVRNVCAEILERFRGRQGALQIDPSQFDTVCAQCMRWAVQHPAPSLLHVLRTFPFAAAHNAHLLGMLCCELLKTEKKLEFSAMPLKPDALDQNLIVQLVQQLLATPSTCLHEQVVTSSGEREDGVSLPADASFDSALQKVFQECALQSANLLQWAAHHHVIRLGQLLLRNEQHALFQSAERGEPTLLRILLAQERNQEPYRKYPQLWDWTLQEALCRVIPSANLSCVRLLLEHATIDTSRKDQSAAQILAVLSDADAFRLVDACAEQGDEELARQLLLVKQRRLRNITELSVNLAKAARLGQFPLLFSVHRLVCEALYDDKYGTGLETTDLAHTCMELFQQLSDVDLRELARLAAMHGDLAVLHDAIRLFFREFATDTSSRDELLIELLRLAVQYGHVQLVGFLGARYPSVLHRAPEACIGQNTVLIYHNRMEEGFTRDKAAALLTELLNVRAPVANSTREHAGTVAPNAGSATDAVAGHQQKHGSRRASQVSRGRYGLDASSVSSMDDDSSRASKRISDGLPSPATFFPGERIRAFDERSPAGAPSDDASFVRITITTPQHQHQHQQSPARMFGTEPHQQEACSVSVNSAGAASSARIQHASLQRQSAGNASNEATPAYLLRGLGSIRQPLLVQMLNWSVRERYAILLQLLLQLGLAISQANLNELLLCAVEGNDLNTMDAFLEAVTRSQRNESVHPVVLDPTADILVRALVLGNTEMALRLLRLNRSISVYRRKLAMKERIQLLLLAAAEGKAELVKLCIRDLDVDVNATDKDGFSALQLALRPLHPERLLPLDTSAIGEQVPMASLQRIQTVIELIERGAKLQLLDEFDLFLVLRALAHAQDSVVAALMRITEFPDDDHDDHDDHDHEPGCLRRFVQSPLGVRILRESISMLQPVVTGMSPTFSARSGTHEQPRSDRSKFQREPDIRGIRGNARRRVPLHSDASLDHAARHEDAAYAVARFLVMYEETLLLHMSVREQWQFLFAAVATGDRAALQKLRGSVFAEAFDPTAWNDVHGRTLLDVAATLEDVQVAEAVMVALTEPFVVAPSVEILVESSDSIAHTSASTGGTSKGDTDAEADADADADADAGAGSLSAAVDPSTPAMRNGTPTGSAAAVHAARAPAFTAPLTTPTERRVFYPEGDADTLQGAHPSPAPRSTCSRSDLGSDLDQERTALPASVRHPTEATRQSASQKENAERGPVVVTNASPEIPPDTTSETSDLAAEQARREALSAPGSPLSLAPPDSSLSSSSLLLSSAGVDASAPIAGGTGSGTSAARTAFAHSTATSNVAPKAMVLERTGRSAHEAGPPTTETQLA